jgi:thiosulfate/3-mercaptopyruvate sulfurtransferase
MGAGEPGPLISIEWLAAHLDDPDLRAVHVSLDRKAYDLGHVPGAVFSDLHVDLAKPGVRPETGTARRQYIVPTREETSEALARWGVAPGRRVVFYDDEGRGRHAIRGYWLLRLYRFPRERVHVLDGGLKVWQAAGLPMTAATAATGGAAPATAAPQVTTAATTEPLGERDDSLIATAEEVLAWSREASVPGGPTRLLDVRRIDEYLGHDVMAARGGRIAGARFRLFDDFVAPDGRLRPAADIVSILRATGVNPDELRATYCQGGIRAALAWFAMSEIAGLTAVRNYAESWEEWGNRPDLPVEM